MGKEVQELVGSRAIWDGHVIHTGITHPSHEHTTSSCQLFSFLLKIPLPAVTTQQSLALTAQTVQLSIHLLLLWVWVGRTGRITLNHQSFVKFLKRNLNKVLWKFGWGSLCYFKANLCFFSQLWFTSNFCAVYSAGSAWPPHTHFTESWEKLSEKAAQTHCKWIDGMGFTLNTYLGKGRRHLFLFSNGSCCQIRDALSNLGAPESSKTLPSWHLGDSCSCK